MTNFPSPTLPSEIQSEIISNLLDDGQTLLTCSLACRAWYDHAISTFWLSRPLKIGSGYSKGLQKIASLCQLLKGPMNRRQCRFACYVKILEVNSGTSLQRPSTQQEKFAYMTINDEIQLLMHYSPHLTNISINWMDIMQLEKATLDVLTVSNLRSLTLQGLNFHVPNSLLSLLSRYKMLQECSIINCRITSRDPLTQLLSTGSDAPSESASSRPTTGSPQLDLDNSSLRRLDIYLNRGFEVVLKQLLSQPSHVVHLRVTWTIPYEFLLVAQVLKHTGSSLETLAIDIGGAIEIGEREDFENFPIKLSSNIRLRALELKTIRIPEEEAYPSAWLHVLLSSMDSPLFETLTFEFSPVYVNDDLLDAVWDASEEYFFDNFDWNMLDEVLSSNRYFDSWRTVQIEVGDADYHLVNDSGNGAIEAEFRSRLPSVEISGKLAVDF